MGAFAFDEDLVEGAVEFAVACSVEAVADRLAGGRGDRCCAGEPGEGGFGGDASFVGPGEDELSCGVWSDAGLVEQLGCELAGEPLDLACELTFLGGQGQDAPGDRAEREQAAAQLRVVSAVGACCCEALQEPCRVSGRSSLRSGSGVVTSRSRS